jgi:hypothetical protein
MSSPKSSPEKFGGFPQDSDPEQHHRHSDNMDDNPAKRRKVAHSGGGTSFVSRASSFALETAELLKNVKVDVAQTFPGADGFLREIKNSVENIKPHGPFPVSVSRKS